MSTKLVLGRLFQSKLVALALLGMGASLWVEACSCDSSDETEIDPTDPGGPTEPSICEGDDCPQLPGEECTPGQCDVGLVCLNGNCQADPCVALDDEALAALGCNADAGETCAARCVPVGDPCAGVECETNQTCFDGQCIDGCFVGDGCSGNECPAGTVCEASGNGFDCVPVDPCDAACPEGYQCDLSCQAPPPEDACGGACTAEEVCDNGECVVDLCKTMSNCSAVERCIVVDDQPTCVDTCACGECEAGQVCSFGECVDIPKQCAGKACGDDDGTGLGTTCRVDSSCDPNSQRCIDTSGNQSFECQCDPQKACEQQGAGCGEVIQACGRSYACRGPCPSGRFCQGSDAGRSCQAYCQCPPAPRACGARKQCSLSGPNACANLNCGSQFCRGDCPDSNQECSGNDYSGWECTAKPPQSCTQADCAANELCNGIECVPCGAGQQVCGSVCCPQGQCTASGVCNGVL